MSWGQVYWDLLHAEHRLGEFSNDIFMLDGVDTRRYNTLFISALHRVMNAKTVVASLLGKERVASLEAEFKENLTQLTA